MDEERDQILDALRTLASFLRAPPDRSHDLILHTQTPDPEAVRKLCAGGKIPGTKIGRKWWLKRADLEAYIENHRAAPRLKNAGSEKRAPEDTVRDLFPGRVVTKR